jgi:hypothetical protein
MTVFMSVFISLLSVHTANAASSTNVDKYLAAIKSAQPLKIEQARVKYVVPGSSADLFSKMVINHFNGTQYLKTLDKFGNVSPTAPDAPGKLTKMKNGTYVLDSTFNTIDGELKDFVLNKSKKISDFKFKQAGSKYVSIKGNLQTLLINYNEGGTEIKSGIHWKLPNSNSFIQVNFKNNFGGFKSWSYARGYVRDASGVNHETVTGPLGCTKSGGSTVIEATTSTNAAIVKNTTSTLVIPFYLSCTGINPKEIKVPFVVQ